MMDIVDALKSSDIYDLRLVSGDDWLYWDDAMNEWVVLKCARYQKRNSVLYKGDDLSAAVDALVK